MLLVAFIFHDKKSNTNPKNLVFTVGVLVSVQSLLIFLSVLPEASPNYRTLLRCLLITIIPIIFLTTHKQKIRNIVAINFLVLLLGLGLVEAAMTVFAPKTAEQQRWSNLATQFSEAPIAETNPVVTVDEPFRNTKFQPKLFKHQILFYGGSTTFNREVSDGDTYPSLTQKLLNEETNSAKVENRGIVGASAIDLAFFLRKYEADYTSLAGPNRGHIVSKINKGDIVVFYIGANEAKGSIAHRDPITRLSLQFSKFEAISNWVFKNTNVGYLLNNLLAIGKPTIDESFLAETEVALNSASNFVTERGAVFIPIIQPHAFTKSNPIIYEQSIRAHMGEFPDAVDSVYPRLADLILQFENSADARKIFDNSPNSPYFDWCHVSKEGNQDVAEFMAKVVKPFIVSEN